MNLQTDSRFARTARLLGEDGLQRLRQAKVALFGLGGVGGYVAEALVRSGVGTLLLVDHDKVDITNLNRKIIATTGTLGMPKVQAAEHRLKDIWPDVHILTSDMFVLPENLDQLDLQDYDYVVDAIDTVSAKIALVMKCRELDIPIICSMGTGNKLDPTRLEVADIYETSMDPLAKIMRSELKKRGVKKLKVVYSKEKPIKSVINEDESNAGRRRSPGSVAFVPAAAGLILAGQVIRDLTEGSWMTEKER